MKRFCMLPTLFLIGLLTVQPALAQETFTFQGRLTGPDGAPVADDTYTVRFQLFEAPTGGSAQWEESHTVTTDDGVFSVLLGSETTLVLDAFDEMPYLALTVEGQALAPRTPLSAVPYAMKSYRLDEAALVAGSNVSITQRSDGALQIGATGGGGTGLTSVATDGTIEGNGTSSSPLGLADGSVTGAKLSNNALVAGANVDIVRRGNGSLEISAAGGGGGGLTQVASDGTLSGDGTAGSPLQVADGAVTGVKIAVGSVTGEKLAVPLILTGSEAGGLIRGENTSGNIGYLGGFGGAAGAHSNGNFGYLGHSDYAVWGQHNNGNEGYLGGSNVAVYGGHNNGKKGYLGQNSYGVLGQNSGGTRQGGLGGDNYAVFGYSNISGHAGYFDGKVHVNGTLSKSSGSFKIDHPLDPANKYLSHSFVESPDMMNVYNGNVTTDANGEAVVMLPDYFETLNRDFRYQLTVIGQFAQAIIAEEIQGNQFVIRTDQPHVKVSWLVTGIRQDAWAEEHRIVVEEDKPVKERGYYLHPRLFGQPQERSILWARDPEMMRELQERPAQNKEE